MKKITFYLLGFITVISLVACDNGNRKQNNSSSSTIVDDSSTLVESNSKVLVAYFSATGNTESVAKEIADTTGGDLFEITPQNPYTDDDLNWSNRNSRVVQEYENESQRETELVQTTVDNWDDYDTVFVGYPIWWGQAAWPINDFITSNDFSGKTVIPFATSSSSEIGDSGTNLATMAGTGDWQEGQRFSGSGNSSEIKDWLQELGY